MIDDPEILELLRDDPELLAIADAIQQTQQAEPGRRRPTWRARAGLGLAACLAIVAVMGAFVLRPSADAGIAGGKYLHVVMERAQAQRVVVSLRDGARRPYVYRDELWIGAHGGVIYAVRSEEGRIVEASRDTASAGRSSLGPTRISPDMRAGAGVNPLVAAYGGPVDAIRNGGHLSSAGPDRMFGHRVRWIVFGKAQPPRRIALDAATGRPVALEYGTTVPSRIEHYTISGKPTLPRVTGRRATFSQNTAGERVSPAGAAAAVPGAVWAGRAVAGLPLRRVLLQRLRQNGVPGWRPGVVLRYGQGAATPWQLTPYLYLSQARRPEAAYQFPGIGGVGPLPPAGSMFVTSSAPEARTTTRTAFVRIQGVYLQLWTNLPLSRLRDVVLRLRPIR